MKIMKVLYRPDKVFENMQNNTSCSTDFIVLSFVLMVVSFFMVPANEQVFYNNGLLATMPAEQIEQIQMVQGKLKYLAVFFAPVILLFKCFIYTVLIYIGVHVMKSRITFRKAMCITVVSYSAMILSDIVDLLVICAGDLKSIGTTFDLHPLSLSSLFQVSSVGPFWMQLMTNVNVFGFWFILLLMTGIKKSTGLETGRAFYISFFSWVIYVVADALRIAFSYNAMQQI